MLRPITLFTGQWADISLDQICERAARWGFDGLELACWGGHFEVQKALKDDDYCLGRWEIFRKYNLGCYALSNHLIGQAVCDLLDERHKMILPTSIWGDGKPEGIKQRAAKEMMDTARAARKFFDLAPPECRESLHNLVVNGFTGSRIWHCLYPFPPVTKEMINAGYRDFAERWNPILDVFDEQGVRFALEVHPGQIAFDVVTAVRAIEEIGGRETFGFNYDPSHLGYQGVDYVGFVRELGPRIYHVHMKDAYWSTTPRRSGVYGGLLPFGHPQRFWDFRSPGRGNIDFEDVIRVLHEVGYRGPLSVEWEDASMDREHGAEESCEYVRGLDFAPSEIRFEESFRQV